MNVIETLRCDAPVDALLVAGAEAWERCRDVPVALEPTPLEAQPSAYVQASWRERPRGNIAGLSVRALLAPDALALRLSWPQEEPRRSIDDYNVYADACAVLFPANGREAAIATMGSEQAPVCGWFWRAGTPEPFEITARGIGTVERSPAHEVQGAGWWSEGHWHVVLARRLAAASAPVLLSSGTTPLAEIPVAFAVWAGARGERAGLKSHSPQFARLRLHA